MIRLALTADTVGPLKRGHPWIYDTGLRTPEQRPPAGTPVQLVDHQDRILGFGLADDGPIAVRVLDRHPEDLQTLVQRRIRAAVQARPAVLPPDTNAYRMVHGEGDGLGGLVVDRYDKVAVIRLYGACWEPHLDPIVATVAETDGIDTVLRRFGVRRVDGRDGIEVLHGPDPAEPLVVSEAGVRFLARPSTGQKTGLFLDQREHRIFLARHAQDRTVLNLFSYTGGFSVHAAMAGAARVVSVDQAGPALEDAKENFRLNGLDPAEHEFVTADVFKWSPAAQMDIVIVDPPSLTHDRTADTAARTAYKDLAQHTGAMVKSGGLLATASCTARLSFDKWETAIREGVGRAGRWSWLWRAAEPPDHPVGLGHPEGRYLKFALLRRWTPRFSDGSD